ncbi:hypothetical protein [Terriglobus saanensis]|uniref:Uncharacterized protein n=1 Tax=Terriglobus saanensis (strain ATCC BAA-1853 / DSM 23119 / SP1PR4) TaxID=401053 RepID=E8V5D5_TERSS|nr:hypothetical protein [Terriglobus saanensis]ADV84894.1 hypothetical protein AciPR4_4148 [Terriglobus saanensis SP1PR4]
MADETETAGSPKPSAKKNATKAAKKRTKKANLAKKTGRVKTKGGPVPSFPRHSVKKALRIPRAILEQNAGRACTDREAVKFAGIAFHGPSRVEISSSIKYGLLSRPADGNVEVTELAKKILRPQGSGDELEGIRSAFLNAPTVSDVYKHYRGENIPDDQFFRNALVDTFKIPDDKVDEFKSVLLEDLSEAQLVEDVGDKRRILDIAREGETSPQSDETLRRISKGVKIEHGDSCFVMMPFAEPLGGYYKSIYEPAITKAGLRAVRADDEIFATGKVMDQIWSGIGAAKVLVAELTGRNPNVFYELGLAHALSKPVVLISSNQEDVPFDLQHIRVIYYDMRDPFWGEKLIAKVSENVVSALKNPGEALLRRVVNAV